MSHVATVCGKLHDVNNQCFSCDQSLDYTTEANHSSQYVKKSVKSHLDTGCLIYIFKLSYMKFTFRFALENI